MFETGTCEKTDNQCNYQKDACDCNEEIETITMQPSNSTVILFILKGLKMIRGPNNY